jgi:hypothetical protein
VGGFIHIVAGAIIGGGAALIKMALEPGDIDWKSGRTWSKIGAGMVTGAAVSAMPVSLLGVAGAGGVAALGDVVDQGIDVKHGLQESINFKKAAGNGLVTALTAGIGGAISKGLIKHGRDVLHASGIVPWYRIYPNLNAAVVNSTFDVLRFVIENNGTFFNKFESNSPNNELPKGIIIIESIKFNGAVPVEN